MGSRPITKSHGRRRALLACTLALAVAGGGTALAAFPDDAPDDPAYNPSEQGGPATCLQRAGDNEQHYLYSFMPQCTPAAGDAENSAGMSLDRAWKEYTPGDSHTLIAYIEGGINWRNAPGELANKVFLNKGELPAPTTNVADGALNAKDYADTADTNGNGLVDPEDIIVRFSDGVDDDHNGYTDDISGWDFYNDQNDPATLDSEYNHANGQMRQAGAETNNGAGEAGVCPKCMVMPIKAGAEALDRTDDLAQAWLYAADMNADVLVSVTADLGYSSFMREAVESVWRRGTVMVEASNDFNSLDHQGGMFWPHVLPGNGLVANSHGLDLIPNSAVLQNGATSTYRARAAFTSWGPHNVFSAATQGGTTSESTPTVGGVMAMVLSYGKKAVRDGLLKRALSPGEAVQVVRSTASDITANPNPPSGWPAKPGFDLQFGYGRPNVYEAMKAISQHKIPPEAWITSPRWYSLFDPAKRKRITVRGHAAAPRSRSYRWRLEFAPGAEPEDGDFMLAGKGSSKRARNGKLGTIDLSKVPASFWKAAFHLSSTKTLETNDEYDLTIRLRVTDARGKVGEERRAIAIHHDPTLHKGFPKRFGPSGEAQPALADLRGSGGQAIIFGDADGRIHAINSRGHELRGFPAHTRRTVVTKRHRGVNPGREPIIANAAVGDLDHNGKQWVVAATTTGRVYVWNSRGKLRKGWPHRLATGVSKPAIPRPDSPFSRPPIQGSSSPPVLANLDSDPQLEIVESGWDGRIHAWNPNGAKLTGWPVAGTLPEGTPTPAGMVVINDEKLDLSPTLAELDGDPQPELLQRLQRSFAKGAGLQVPLGGKSNVVAFNNDGTRVPNFLISGDALAFYYGSAQEFITEGTNNPTTADTDGDGKTEIASAAGIFSPTTLYNPDGSQKTVMGPVPGNVLALAQGDPTALLEAFSGNLPSDAPVNFTTSGAFGEFGPADTLAYAEPGSGGASVAGSLLLAGSGLPIKNYMRSFDPATGAAVPGTDGAPEAQGLDFLGGPAIADLDGDGKAELIQGGDSSAMHAFTSSGAQAAGFPKFQTGWTVWGPAVGDLNSDGKVELVTTTREGYLMAWDTDGRAGANDQWWGYRHDERNTGMYGIDTRSPGSLRKARVHLRKATITFKAPGDDWYAGKADHYVVQTGNGKKRRRANVPAHAAAGGLETLAIPKRTRWARIWAVDDAGNRGRARVSRLVRRVRHHPRR